MVRTCRDDPAQRDESYLWEGGRLEDAESYNRNHPEVLNDLESTFLATSISKREFERNKEEVRQQRELQLSREREAEAHARAEDARAAAQRQEQLTRVAQRRTRAALLALGVALLAVGAAGVSGWLAKRSGDTARQALAQAEQASDTARHALTTQLKMFTEPTKIAGRIAAGVSNRQPGEVAEAFRQLSSGTAPFANTAEIQEATAELLQTIGNWKSDEKPSRHVSEEPTSEDVRQAVLKFAASIRAAWESQVRDEGARTLSLEIIVKPTFDRAIHVARRLAEGRIDSVNYGEFESLYWSELVFLEPKEVASAMVKIRQEIGRMNEGRLRPMANPDAKEDDLTTLRTSAQELEQACNTALEQNRILR